MVLLSLDRPSVHGRQRKQYAPVHVRALQQRTDPHLRESSGTKEWQPDRTSTIARPAQAGGGDRNPIAAVQRCGPWKRESRAGQYLLSQIVRRSWHRSASLRPVPSEK